MIFRNIATFFHWHISHFKIDALFVQRKWRHVKVLLHYKKYKNYKNLWLFKRCLNSKFKRMGLKWHWKAILAFNMRNNILANLLHRSPHDCPGNIHFQNYTYVHVIPPNNWIKFSKSKSFCPFIEQLYITICIIVP